MTIKLPDNFRGIDGKKAYERIMNEPDEQETKEENQNIKPHQDKEGFIYVPSINLYVAKEKSFLGKNWFDCHEKLQENNQRMLILPEFIEFLKYTKNNYEDIYNEITGLGDWRAEWLDADFKMKNNELYVNYNHRLDADGNLIPKNSELLDENTLMQDKKPGISLEDYLFNNHTKQGLPNKNVKEGDLWYWYPKDKKVARFVVGSVGAGLYCYRNPSDGNSDLGVRRVLLD